MNKIDKSKSPYISPDIRMIKLDNEISLQLESAPPEGPQETSEITPEYFNNDPFKANLA
jgi:hypothetical protein